MHGGSGLLRMTVQSTIQMCFKYALNRRIKE